MIGYPLLGIAFACLFAYGYAPTQRWRRILVGAFVGLVTWFAVAGANVYWRHASIVCAWDGNLVHFLAGNLFCTSDEAAAGVSPAAAKFQLLLCARREIGLTDLDCVGSDGAIGILRTAHEYHLTFGEVAHRASDHFAHLSRVVQQNDFRARLIAVCLP